jgi:myo-inositol-1(or 4)-monophosphatase
MQDQSQEMTVDLDRLVSTVCEAGGVALGRAFDGRATRKADRTWVTEVDVAVEEFLAGALTALAPGTRILGEEGGLRGEGEGTGVWAVDPIDGTADFMRGLPGWSVSVALLDWSGTVVGVVYMPVTGDLYVYERGRATWRTQAVSVLRDENLHDESLLLVPNGAAHRYEIDHPGKIQCVGSSSAHILYVARGAAAAALVDPLYIWDLGVALPFLRATGGDACYISGDPVSLSELYDGTVTPEPVVFAPKQILPSVWRMIAEKI